MKYRLVVLLLALTLLMGIPAAFTAFAEETVILPSWVYDFTNSSITAYIGGGIHNLTYLLHDSSHTTLAALGGDPQLLLLSPNIYVGSAKYLCIEYRTESCEQGGIFVSRDDGISMGETPEATVKWDWMTDGEWHRLIVYCEGWADAEDAVMTAFRFDPVRLGLEEGNGETIDIRFLAFFREEQDAVDFDLAAYQKYVSVHGPLIPEGAVPSSPWPAPTIRM